MADLTELREKQQKYIHDAREALDQIDSVDESRAKELEEQHDRAMEKHDQIEEQAKRLQKIADAEQRLSNSPAPEVPERKPEGNGEVRSYREIFADHLRYGSASLSSEERNELRAQATSPGADGGNTVDGEFFNELMQTMQAWGPMLNPGVTRQITTSTGAELQWPTLDDTANKGSLLGENTQDSTSQLAFGQKQLDAYKYTSGIFQVSEELLQDSAVNVEQIIQEAMAERIGRIVNEHLTTGTGSGQPNGIVTAAGTGVTATATNALDADELIDLYHSIDPAYRNSPSMAWMFSDDTLKAIRKLKDGQGNYLWQEPNLRTGEPGLFMNTPYAINQDMPAIATSSNPIVIGDMSRYIVRRVREFAIRRLVERYADFYQVGFVGFGRFDGELIDNNAVKTLTMAAA